MGRKCSAYGCKTGYATTKADKKIVLHSFPTDRSDLEKWIKKLPNKLSPEQVTRNMGVCFRHKNIALVFFQLDDIEKHFAHFRISAGCNFYITAQDVAHAHAIDTARLLSECVDLDFNYRETAYL